MSDPTLAPSHVLFLAFFAKLQHRLEEFKASRIRIKFAHLWENYGLTGVWGFNFHFDEPGEYSESVSIIIPGKVDQSARAARFYEILPFLVSQLDTPSLSSFEEYDEEVDIVQGMPEDSAFSKSLTTPPDLSDRPFGDEFPEIVEKIEGEFRQWRKFIEVNFGAETLPFQLEGCVILEIQHASLRYDYLAFIRLSSKDSDSEEDLRERAADSASRAISAYMDKLEKESNEYKVINTFVQKVWKRRMKWRRIERVERALSHE